MLPDESILIGQQLVENAKIEKFKCDILSDFQTLCNRLEIWYCSFFVYTILNFPRFFSTESGPSNVREIQNSENKKYTISEF